MNIPKVGQSQGAKDPMSLPCVFSPFSPHLMRKNPYRILTLQFFIKNLLAAHTALINKAPSQKIVTPNPTHFPYAWGRPSGYLNKSQEHLHLLLVAFPSFSKELQEIQHLLDKLMDQFLRSNPLPPKHLHVAKKRIHQIGCLIDPLIRHLKSSENLIFFLLQHQVALDTLMGSHYLQDLLNTFEERGLQILETTLCQNYRKRGFPFLISHLKTLMSDMHQK